MPYYFHSLHPIAPPRGGSLQPMRLSLIRIREPREEATEEDYGCSPRWELSLGVIVGCLRTGTWSL